MRLTFIACFTAILCCYAHGIAFAVASSGVNRSATVHIKHTGEIRRFIEWSNGREGCFVKSGGYSYLAW
jgi:hypothetical protein